MDNQTHIKQLFQRYLDDQASQEEVEELITYLKDHRNEQLFSDLIQDGLDEQHLSQTKDLSPEQQNNIAYVRRVLEDFATVHTETTTNHRRRFLHSFMRYAAVFILFAVSALSIWFYLRTDTESEFAEEIIVRTLVGEKKRIVLPDGSKVHLNHLSSISYPPKFLEEKREVVISGEVSFEVEKDPKIPFIVRSLDLETQVLGTSFIVKAYDDDSYITVSVLEGKVAVNDSRHGHSASILTKNEQVVYDKVRQKMGDVRQLKQGDIGTWEQGIIRLRDMSFQEAIKVLERTYDIKIAFSDNLKDCPIYADINERDSVEKVLSLLALSINGKYKHVDDTMWKVSGTGCMP